MGEGEDMWRECEEVRKGTNKLLCLMKIIVFLFFKKSHTKLKKKNLHKSNGPSRH